MNAIMDFHVHTNYSSDAHSARRIGDIDKALKIAKEIGYKEICIYEKRKPRFIKIEEVMK